MKQNNNWFIGLGILLALLLTGAKDPEVKKKSKMQLSGQVLKILTFNICEGDNRIIGIDSGSPLCGRPRHADIGGVILESGADIVGDIPSDPKVFEKQVLETISIPDTYQKNLDSMQPHLN